MVMNSNFVRNGGVTLQSSLQGKTAKVWIYSLDESDSSVLSEVK